jgi:hypothetical protein
MMKNDLQVFLVLVLIPTILAPIHIKDTIAVVLKICRCWSYDRRQYGVVGGGGWHMLDGCAVGKEGASSSAVIRERQAKEGGSREGRITADSLAWSGGEGVKCEMGVLQVRKGHRHQL